MDIGSIFLILALLILVGLFISRPLLEKNQVFEEKDIERDDHDLSALLAERDRILNSLYELDSDYALGKIPEEDYPIQRTVLLEKGAQVLQDLDNIKGRETGGESAIGSTKNLPAIQLNSNNNEVAFLHMQPGLNGSLQLNGRNHSIVGSPDDELEILLANRRRLHQEKAVGFCPKCGHVLHATDRFCPKCGNKL